MAPEGLTPSFLETSGHPDPNISKSFKYQPKPTHDDPVYGQYYVFEPNVRGRKVDRPENRFFEKTGPENCKYKKSGLKSYGKPEH